MDSSMVRPTILLVLSVTLLLLGVTTGVTAQAGSPSLTVLDVDSSAFPQVTVHVAVANGAGLPVAGLGDADVTVSEDGTAVPVEDVAVRSAAAQNLRIVLALDTSIPDEARTEIRDAALTIVDGIGATDRLALIFFQNESVLRQDFTNNTQVLRSAIESLPEEGAFTALHAATRQAVETAASEPDGRKAIILVTNSGDNADSLPREQMLDALDGADAPIYAVGFGDQLDAGTLREIAERTGGASYIVADAASAGVVLRTFSPLLRQSYAVSFQSGLPADGEAHDLTIRVGDTGTTAEFTAVPGEIALSLSGIDDGQTVAGTVELRADVEAPAPITSVEYAVNGQLLTTLTQPPFEFSWDSTSVEPGAYQLAVTAMDSAGNTAHVERSITVVTPVLVSASLENSEVQVGEPLTVNAQVDAPAGIDEVNVLVNGELVAGAATPPFSFELDSSDFDAGAHTIVVRAEDTLGRAGATTLTAQIVAAPQSNDMWVQVGLALLALVVGLASAALLQAILNWQRTLRRRAFRLDLHNTGNVPSGYALRGIDPAGALGFLFLLNGTPLPKQTRPAPMVHEQPAQQPRQRTPSREPPPVEGEDAGGPDARERAGQIAQSGSAIVGIVQSASQVLPKSIRAPIMRAIRPVYQAQQQTRRVQVQTNRVQRAGQHVSQIPGQVGLGGGESGQPQTESESESQPRQRSPAVATANGHTRGASTTPTSPTQPQTDEYMWFLTPEIAPGDTLSCTALIDPGLFRSAHQYTFKIISQSSAHDDSTEVTADGHVELAGTSWIRHYLPFVLFAIVALGAGWVTAILIAGVGIIG